MFIQVLIIIILTFLFYTIVKSFMLSRHEFFTTQNQIKYKLNDSDYEYIKKYGKQIDYIPKNTQGIFYTTTKWKASKNNYNNYMLFNGKYYIIEPGYYYVAKPGIVYNTDKIKILFVEKK